MSQSDFVTRGQALVSAGQYQEAVKVCRLGLLGRPTTVDGRVVLGQALLALKRFDEVLAEMRVALDLDATSIEAQVLRGEAQLRKKDYAGAADTLRRARTQAPTDPRIAGLLAEAERGGAGRPRVTASHAAVAFVSPQPPMLPDPPDRGSEANTREAQTREAMTRDFAGDSDDAGGSYTRPTSLAAPGAKKRTPAPLFGGAAGAKGKPARPVVEKTGTVDIDPMAEGIEMPDDDDDDLAAPPVPRGTVPNGAGGARGRVIPAKRVEESSTHELDDDEVMDLDETPEPVMMGGKPKMSRTAARRAVQMPSGPLDAYVPASAKPDAATHHAGAGSVPSLPQAPPPHLAALIAAQPGAPGPFTQQSIKAAMPTAAALPMPGQPLSAAQQQSADVVDSLFGAGGGLPPMQPPPYGGPTAAPYPAPYGQPYPDPYAAPGLAAPNQPAWMRATMVPGGPPDPMMQAQLQAAAAAQQGGPLPQTQPEALPYDAMQAQQGYPAGMYQAEPMPMMQAVALPDPFGGQSQASARAMKTGMRRVRSRFQIAIWIVLGTAMIGGGVFAGFKIRALRLEKQIAEARGQAVALAKEDAWRGWVGARDRLSGIARASGTIDNRAALARVRGLVAFEFGDGFEEAKTAVAGLGDGGGLDGAIASAYLALAASDAPGARAAVDRAMELAPEDPSTLYVAGRAALLLGDTKAAIRQLEAALKLDPRPLVQVGLARALGDAGRWDDAIAAVDKVLVASPELASAVIERARLLAASARLSAQSPATADIRVRLLKLVAEGGKAPADQSTRGVSPSQVAYGYMMLARVDHARNELQSAQSHIHNALVLTDELKLDDQRFAEDVIETLYALGVVKQSRQAAVVTLQRWPQSRRAITGLAQAALAEGDGAAALAAFGKLDLDGWPASLVVRAAAKAATADEDGARADLAAALKHTPGYEPALIGLAWLDLAAGDVDEARKRVEPKLPAKDGVLPSPALATVYAAILRTGGALEERQRARDLMLAVVAGPPTLDLPRAYLELARLHRDLGELKLARQAATEAIARGSVEAKLEAGLLLLEDKDPTGAAATLAALVKEAGDGASAKLLLEAARTAMLAGDHVSTQAYLERVDKLPDVVRWQLERERARFFARKGDYTGAAEQLLRALENSGSDADTLLLAAEVATADDPPQPALAEKVRSLAPTRLANQSEAQIVAAKLLVADGKLDDALAAFQAAEQSIIAKQGSNRRRAQATYGLAYILYLKGDDARAEPAFQLVTTLDPTIYAAYLYAADLKKDREPKKAVELAQMAVRLNPDTVRGWYLLGVVAAAVNNKKLLDEAILQVNEIAPNSEALLDLQQRQRR